MRALRRGRSTFRFIVGRMEPRWRRPVSLDKARVRILLSMRRWRLGGLWRSCHGLLAGGKTLGGILGRTSLGLLFLDLVFLPKELRGRDLGSHMLRLAEEEGVRRGCRSAMLYTISFQAPGFYERHGWHEFGRIPCDPPGTSRIFMTKALPPAAAAD